MSHPGSLQYYREEFEKNGFAILSEHNFSYSTRDYCPGAFWQVLTPYRLRDRRTIVL